MAPLTSLVSRTHLPTPCAWLLLPDAAAERYKVGSELLLLSALVGVVVRPASVVAMIILVVGHVTLPHTMAHKVSRACKCSATSSLLNPPFDACGTLTGAANFMPRAKIFACADAPHPARPTGQRLKMSGAERPSIP